MFVVFLILFIFPIIRVKSLCAVGMSQSYRSGQVEQGSGSDPSRNRESKSKRIRSQEDKRATKKAQDDALDLANELAEDAKKLEKKLKEDAKPPPKGWVPGSEWTKQHATHLNIEFANWVVTLPCLEKAGIPTHDKSRLEPSFRRCLQDSVQAAETECHEGMFIKANQTQAGPWLAYLAMTRQNWPFEGFIHHADELDLSSEHQIPTGEQSNSTTPPASSSERGFMTHISRLETDPEIPKTPDRVTAGSETIDHDWTPQTKAEKMKKPEIIPNTMIILFTQLVAESSRKILQALSSEPSESKESKKCYLEWYFLAMPLKVVTNTKSIDSISINDGSLFCKTWHNNVWLNLSPLVYCSIEVSTLPLVI